MRANRKGVALDTLRGQCPLMLRIVTRSVSGVSRGSQTGSDSRGLMDKNRIEAFVVGRAGA